MPNFGGGAKGAAGGALTGAEIGSLVPGIGTAIGASVGAIGGGLMGLFGGGGNKNNPDLDAILKTLRESSTATRAQGDALTAQGASTLTPILDYFKKLAGGDPNAVQQATRPQRTRVIDQYDTARKTIGEFSPRGGGSNAALASSRFNEASDISNIEATAQQNAADTGAQIGVQLEGMGLQGKALASSDLNSVVQALVAKRGQNANAASGLSEGLGQLLGLLLTKNKDGGGGSGSSANWSDIFSAGATGV